MILHKYRCIEALTSHICMSVFSHLQACSSPTSQSRSSKHTLGATIFMAQIYTPRSSVKSSVSATHTCCNVRNGKDFIKSIPSIICKVSYQELKEHDPAKMHHERANGEPEDRPIHQNKAPTSLQTRYLPFQGLSLMSCSNFLILCSTQLTLENISYFVHLRNFKVHLSQFIISGLQKATRRENESIHRNKSLCTCSMKFSVPASKGVSIVGHLEED